MLGASHLAHVLAVRDHVLEGGRGRGGAACGLENAAKAVSSSASTPASVAASSAWRPHSRTAGETNAGTNVTMQSPLFSARRSSTSSGTLRGRSQTARAEECEKMTGASVASRASRIVSAETCERSTSIPSRFISRTTSRPNAESPPSTGSSVAESAHARCRCGSG